MGARLMSLLIWAAVAATAVVWALKMGVQAEPVPAQAVTALPTVATGGDLGRVFGQAPAVAVVAEEAAPTDSRFQLVGVVAPKGAARSGLALISIDGKPARALQVGRELEPGLTLVSVGHRQVELGRQGAAALRLELTPVPEAQRGRPSDGAMAVPAGFGAMVPGAAGLPPMAVGQVPPGLRRGQVLRMPPAVAPGMGAAAPVQSEPDATPVGSPQDPPTAGRMQLR